MKAICRHLATDDNKGTKEGMDMKLSLPAVIGLTGLTAIAACAAGAKKAHLPLVIYNNGAYGAYAPSGYMGDSGSVKMNANSAVHPPSAKKSLQVTYTGGSQHWAGVVWQDPPNDWGTAPGGFDLRGARKLTFWAKGDKGGEVVDFKLGIYDRTKKFPDSGSGQLIGAHLTKNWKQYTISLKGINTADIKTGFVWVAATPETFYISGVQYQ
jgi:hypothetical protein